MTADHDKEEETPWGTEDEELVDVVKRNALRKRKEPPAKQ